MITIHFQNVGRDKVSWCEEIREASEASIMRALRKRKALASREVWVEDGEILAGGRLVGRYTILPDQTALTE